MNNQEKCPECQEPLINDVVREKRIKRCRKQDCVIKTRMREIDQIINGHEKKRSP